MRGEPEDDPLTIMGDGEDRGYGKDTDGIRAEGDEGSTEGREEHDGGGGWRGEPNGGLEEDDGVIPKFM